MLDEHTTRVKLPKCRNLMSLVASPLIHFPKQGLA